MPVPAPVAVGFDGSAASQVAVRWAMTEARLRRRPLLIVHAFLALAPLRSDSPEAEAAAVRRAVGELLEAEVTRVRELAPDLDVSGVLVNGLTASNTLVDMSRSCELMVVGTRGRNGLTGLLLGSVATQVVEHACCPVLVARPGTDDTDPPDGRVVVGVDGSTLSHEALRFGFEEASMRGAELLAVHAWRHPASLAGGDLVKLVRDEAELADEKERLLTDSLAGWQEKYPDVTVLRQLTHGDPRQVLKDASAGALLLVVGARGLGGFAGLLLGSTSQTLAHHAHSPVAIVHPGRSGYRR